MTVLYSRVSKTRAFYVCRVDALGVIRWAQRSIAHDEFLEHLEVMAESVAQLGSARVFVNWVGSYAANPKQRALLKEQQTRIGAAGLDRLAVISDSLLVRGAFTALNWLLIMDYPTHAYPPRELDAALAWLREAASFDVAEAKHEIERSARLLAS